MQFLFSYSNRFSRTILTSIHLHPDGCGPTKELQIQLALLMSVHTYSNKYVGVAKRDMRIPVYYVVRVEVEGIWKWENVPCFRHGRDRMYGQDCNTKRSRTQDSLRAFLSSIKVFSRFPFNVSFFFHTQSIASIRNPSFYSKKPLCNIGHRQ